MKIKPAYYRTRITTVIAEDRKTKCVQSEKKNADINNIVARAYQSGQLPVLMNRQPLPDFPTEATYQDMLNKVVFAQQAFERLPSNIRTEFENKPEKMLQAIEHSKKDEKLKAKLQEYGILDKPVGEAPPQKVEIVNQVNPDTKTVVPEGQPAA